MNDRALELLGQYDIEVVRTRKGRGSIVCDTADGCLIFKEYRGNDKRAQLQDWLLGRIAREGKVRTERIIPNRDGGLLARDGDGTAYILKTWQDGRECSIGERGECVQAVKLLARLHEAMELPLEEAERLADCPAGNPAADPLEKPAANPLERSAANPLERSTGWEYERHNREIRKVRKYLKQKGQKQPFEIRLLESCDYFLEQALEVTEEWKQYQETFDRRDRRAEKAKTVSFCHGDYQYHNILLGQGGWMVVNFEKCLADRPVGDLYLLLRKLLEKGNWQTAMGVELLQTYERERPLTAEDRIDLYYRMAYPEKFWKIVNFYYNSGKAWIPGKNQEKLEKLTAQEKEKQRFLNEVFRDVRR